jgi:hypothetical protein
VTLLEAVACAEQILGHNRRSMGQGYKSLENRADIAKTVTTTLAQKTSTALATKMARLIAVTGATGNQGGSVAKLLLKYRNGSGQAHSIVTRPRDLESPGSCCELAPREADGGL